MVVVLAVGVLAAYFRDFPEVAVVPQISLVHLTILAPAM
jgi:hypothetical protein